jgi:membrane fusion protein, multidrug efflux system
MNRRIFVMSALLATTALAGCDQDAKGQSAPPPRPVLTLTAQLEDKLALTFAGVVEPRYRTSLGFQVLGRIDQRLVAVGDRVKRGQVLATIDPSGLQQALDSAKAAVRAAAAQLDAAKATYARNQKLRAGNIVSASDEENARAALDTANAALTRASSAEARAQEQLSYSRLTSEYDGVVTAIQAEVGQVVNAGTPVMTVARATALDAVIDVPTDALHALSTGAKLVVQLQIDPSLQAEGFVREIAPAADTATRTRRVRLDLSSPPAEFRIGTTISATWTRPRTTFVDIPRSAVFEAGGKTNVWIVDPDKRAVQPRQVQIEETNEKSVHVSSGIGRGDLVVVAGVRSLQDGQAVTLSAETIR